MGPVGQAQGRPSFVLAGSLAYTILLVAAVAFLSPPLERQVRDAMTTLASPFTQPRPGVVVVVVTDATLSRFPYRSPIDRSFLADAIECIARARPQALGVDLIFDQPTEPAKDTRLRSVLDAADIPIVLASVAMGPRRPNSTISEPSRRKRPRSTMRQQRCKWKTLEPLWRFGHKLF